MQREEWIQEAVKVMTQIYHKWYIANDNHDLSCAFCENLIYENIDPFKLGGGMKVWRQEGNHADGCPIDLIWKLLKKENEGLED
jgi:hypothetical protein